jgi:peptidoglycan/LPS O-acetylase OafA/YrhL
MIYLLLRKLGTEPFIVLGLWVIAVAVSVQTPIFMAVPFFMGGVFAFQLSRRTTYRAPAILWPVVLVLLLAMYGWFRSKFEDDLRADYVMSMFLGGLIPNFCDLKLSWFTSGCKTIAKYSYGIYLFHLPIIWLVFIKLMFLPLVVRWAMLSVLICVLPWLAYHLVEGPMIRIGRRLASR